MKAQTISEYMIMISIIVMTAIALFPMTKRGLQSLVKTGADQIGGQINSEQDFASASGHLIDSQTTTNQVQHDTTRYFPGRVQYSEDGSEVTTVTNSFTNSGFTVSYD